MAVKKSTTTPTLTAFVTIHLELGIPLKATTLDAALIEATDRKVTDVLDLSNVDYNDGSIKVTGLYINE